MQNSVILTRTTTGCPFLEPFTFGLSLFATLIAAGDGTANGGPSALPQIFLFGTVLSAVAILPAMAISAKYRSFNVK
jgi:hypothetical protein